MRYAYPIGGAICAICVLIAVYYLLPGVNHVLVSEDPLGRHVKHALAFLALAVVALIGARFAANAETHL